MNPHPPPDLYPGRLVRVGRFWFILALLALFAAVSVQYSIKVLHSRGAFTRWGDHILHSVDGADAGEPYNYPNPPIMAVILYPMARMPAPWGALTWFYVKVALTLLALLWVFRLVETRGRPCPMWARVLTVLLSLGPIVGDLHHGNVNLFILFLVVAALAAFRRRRDLLSGLLLGLAVACKVTPALFIPYFLWKRQWRVLAGCAAGLLLFLWPGLVPATILGWDANQKQVAGWYAEMVHPFVVEGKVTSEHNNQSLPGLVSRLATHSPSFTTYVKDEKTGQDVQTPIEYDNVVDLPPAAGAVAGEGLHGPVRAGRGLALPDADAAARELAPRRGVQLDPARHVAVQRADVEAPLRHAGAAVRGDLLLPGDAAGRPVGALGGDRGAGGGGDFDAVHHLRRLRRLHGPCGRVGPV